MQMSNVFALVDKIYYSRKKIANALKRQMSNIIAFAVKIQIKNTRAIYVNGQKNT